VAEKRKYDSTVARIAGNLLSGMMATNPPISAGDIKNAVEAARAIVAEVERTEPSPDLARQIGQQVIERDQRIEEAMDGLFEDTEG
jgi:hypothetical protein